MKIVFMGTPEYATTILDRLIKQDYEVVALFTQPDKKVGRKQIVTPPHIKQYCLDNNLNIPIYQPLTLKDGSSDNLIKDLKPDFIIVAAYGQILPKSILDIAPCINLHASLLPKYRGASPIQESLLNDDIYTGVTSMLMEEGLDSGDVLGYEYLKITSTMDVSEAFEKLATIAANLTIDTLEKYQYITPKKQQDYGVSYCNKIKKSDGEITFNDAKEISLKYKAYSFWPGIFTLGGLKLSEITLNEYESLNNEGIVLDIQKNHITIGCKKGSINVSSLQMPSKKALYVRDFLSGNQNIKIGTNIIQELFPELDI